MKEKNKKVHWVLPIEIERKKFENFGKESEIISIKALAFDLIKGQPEENDIIIKTPVGDLVYRNRINHAGENMMKRFNATKTFCSKLFPKVTRKLFPEGNVIDYDFKNIDSIQDFISKVKASGVILGVVGQDGRGGVLKRVSPISPLQQVDEASSSLMEAYDVYSTIETLFEKAGLIEDDLERESKYDGLQMILG